MIPGIVIGIATLIALVTAFTISGVTPRRIDGNTARGVAIGSGVIPAAWA